LRHGWTLPDVHRLAVVVVTRDVWSSYLFSFDERLEMAWSAMMETIFFAEDRPSTLDLLKAGTGAIQREAQALRGLHGKANAQSKRVTSPGLNFHRYWWQRSASGFEEQITDAVAVGQIWERLTPRQQMVLEALGEADGDAQAAAESLEFSLVYFRQLLKEARTHFLEWWHEGERPSRIWMHDGPPISTMALMSTLRKRKRKAMAAAEQGK
jgi:hypothetical protein